MPRAAGRVRWDTLLDRDSLVFRVIAQGTGLAKRAGMSTFFALVPTLVAVGIFAGVLRLRPGP